MLLSRPTIIVGDWDLIPPESSVKQQRTCTTELSMWWAREQGYSTPISHRLWAAASLTLEKSLEQKGSNTGSWKSALSGKSWWIEAGQEQGLLQEGKGHVDKSSFSPRPHLTNHLSPEKKEWHICLVNLEEEDEHAWLRVSWVISLSDLLAHIEGP